MLLESSPYRPRLLVTTPDGLGLLNPETRQWLGYLDARFDRVHGVDWSADGQRLFVMIDGFVHVVNADTGQTLGIVDGEQVISAPDADTLWTKGPAHFLRFRVSSGLDTAAIKGKAAQNSLVAVDTQGRPARARNRAPNYLMREEAQRKLALIPMPRARTVAPAAAAPRMAAVTLPATPV